MKKLYLALLISAFGYGQGAFAENQIPENQGQISQEQAQSQSNTIQPEDNKDFLKKKINNILTKNVVVNITTPEEYIANLDTTDFVKGLLLENVVLSNSIAQNKDNEYKLDSIAQDIINNTACQQVIMKEESLVHYQRLMNLLFKTPEQRKAFVEGQENLNKHIQGVKFDREFIEYCKTQSY